jgi:putative transposase
MARLARLVVAGLPHLVLHESHGGQALFRDDADRAQFKLILSEATRDHGLALHAYSLEVEYVGLLMTPRTTEGFSRGLQLISGRYAAAFNRRHGRSGGLWNGRFRATVLDPDAFMLSAMRFLEARDEPALGVQTSRLHHTRGDTDPLIEDHPVYWALGNTPFEREAAYRAYLEDPQEAQKLLVVEASLRKGWALGSDEAFLTRLAEATPRRAIALKPGRPRASR